MKLIIVMPGYNCENFLEKTYEAVPQKYKSNLLLVDDGSTDNTWQIAQRLGIRAIRHSKNRGYGGAQKTGFSHALEHGADIIVLMHADFQHDPHFLNRLIQPLEEDKADIVLGSRILHGKVVQQGMPFYKYIGNRFTTIVNNFLAGAKISDYHTGFRAFTRAALQDINYETNSNGYIFDNEILLQAIARKIKILEIPISTRYPKGVSSIDFMGSIRYGLATEKVILKFFLARLKLIVTNQYCFINKNERLTDEKETQAS